MWLLLLATGRGTYWSWPIHLGGVLLCSGLLAYVSWSGALTLRSMSGPQKLCPPASTFSRLNGINSGSWDFWWPSVKKADMEDGGECALAELNQKKRQRPLPDFIEPLVIVIKYLWRILSQSSLHITKTILCSYLPKWTIFLHDKRHCLYPQCPSKTYICMDFWLM